MQKRFKDKVGIITGAASGIGLEIANHLMSEGANLVINDINEDALTTSFADQMLMESSQCKTVAGNAENRNLITKLVETAIETYGKLDFAVANAGLTSFGDFFDFTEEQFSHIMNLNLGGSFFLAQAAARQMRAQGNGGSILLVSSVLGFQAYPHLTAYAMSKAALTMMARSLVVELSPYNITINCLAPGATLTPRTALEESDYAQTWSQLIPVGEVCQPSDIAPSALFLLSEDARHITGQTLIIDGGWTAVSKYPDQNATK